MNGKSFAGVELVMLADRKPLPSKTRTAPQLLSGAPWVSLATDFASYVTL